MSIDSSRTRVAIFIPSMRGGGAERVMSIVANELSARGYRVDLLLAKQEGPYLREIAREVNVIDFDASRVLYTLWPLIKYLRGRNPSVLLSALPHANIISTIAHAATRSHSRLVISERGAPTISSDSSSTGKLVSLLRRICYPHADSVIAVSEGVGNELIRYFGIPAGKISVINNPLAIDHIQVQSEENIDHPWIRSKHDPVFLAAGRLNKIKDYHTMLRAFAIVNSQRPSKLIILGQGSLENKLSDFARYLGVSDRVEFVGFDPNPYAWMAKCDVFLLSSISEGFPNSLAQAMACGAQVVSTECPYGPSDILEGGKWGRLVPVGDAEAFAGAILSTLDDQSPPPVRDRAAQFSTESIISQYIRELQI